ncbi:HYR-like domain-containing protein [Chitinophaga tropicalis]|uniref:Secreted protein (Por secretion system target) n=1 Tax=Chitinophaga tropicalis TaxID=2683588 RepID=A0A7K1U7I0_9BACT|nr:hypothetical protein [Chitinophaga tropicalis]MVT10310.1 hypothetical protein [Chitinophaga tropicalis]
MNSALLILLFTLSQSSVRGQSANLDQGANEKATTPLTPVDWINGNLNMNVAHFLEGYSVPYRAILKDLVVNQTYTLVIGFDIKNSGKHALDYITHFQRLEPHTVFGHGAETVNPLLNITGFPPSYFTSTDVEPIPAPSSAGSPVAGQPTTSFNALSAGERVFTGYNADLLSVTYSSEGNLAAAQSETVVHVTFKALKETVVLAWGGHIASVVDWGKDPVTHESRSASAISGSPYHMSLKNWIINGSVVSIGNQDRSLKTDAVFIPPKCDVTGPVTGCLETTKLVYTATVDDADGLTYAWSIIGANTANAKIVDPTLGTIEVVPIGTTFTAGSFNLRLIVTREGLKDTCYLNNHTNPGATVNISQVTVNAGADQNITHLDVASLSASASGGTEPYTFSWTPVTGLDNPNIFNPTFTPPSTGVFEFIVKAVDANNCQDVDTVVITVTEHPKPPCGITGPDPVCPGSKNEYTGPPAAEVGSYLWSVTGDASVSGDNNKETVWIQADNKCGSYLIKLIVSTPDGKRKDTCYKEVIIKDTIKPVLSGDVTGATVKCAKDIPAPPVITASDNCTAELNIEKSAVTSDSTCVNKFKITRKWWATDICGNTSDTLTQVIIVNDDVKPVITADFDKEVSVQCLKEVPALPEPTATDNCNGSITPVYTAEGSGTACDSTITRKWVFADACGNSDSVTQVIKIKDDIKPVISADFEKEISVQCLKDVPEPPRPTATDNCDGDVAAVCSAEGSGTACDSTITRKWVFTDACGNSDSVTQVIHIKDNIAPVLSGTTEDVNVKCTADIPAAADIKATDNCGDPKVYYKQIVSDSTCPNGYNVVRKWWAKDACGNVSDTLKQVIKVYDDEKPVITADFDKLIEVSCLKDVPAAPKPTAKDNCNGDITPVYTVKGYGTFCDSTITRKWVFTDACGNRDSVKQVIKVKDTTAPIVTYKPANTTLPCASTPVFGTPTFSDNCGGSLKVTYVDTKDETKCPFTYTRRWTAKDACNNSVWTEQTISVECCSTSFCTYTQGFYGNTGGKGCTPNGTTLTSKQMMTAAVDAQDGDSVIFGLKSTGKFFTLFLSDIANDNIFKMLPGGGTPVALKGYATYSKTNTWSNVPVLTTVTNYGKINNVLLAQTMALFFNTYLSPTLKTMPIECDTVYTVKLAACGSKLPGGTVSKYVIPASVVNYLRSVGKANVAGLFELANLYLGGQTVPGVAIGDVSKAADAINNAFDKCAFLVRWACSSGITNLKVSGLSVIAADSKITDPSVVNKLEVNVFPNPYRDKLIFRFTAPETGQVKLETYNMLGQQVGQLNYGTVNKGTTHTIIYDVPSAQRTALLYRLSVGKYFTTGKAIPDKE